MVFVLNAKDNNFKIFRQKNIYFLWIYNFFCWALHRERQSISCFVTQVIIFIQIYYSIKMSSGFKIHHLDWLEETKQLYNFLLVLFRLKISSLFSVKLSLFFSLSLSSPSVGVLLIISFQLFPLLACFFAYICRIYITLILIFPLLLFFFILIILRFVFVSFFFRFFLLFTLQHC